jgi:hypothetical protein
MRIAISVKDVADIVEREFKSRGINMKLTDRAIGRVGQIVAQTVEKRYAKDLKTYARFVLFYIL